MYQIVVNAVETLQNFGENDLIIWRGAKLKILFSDRTLYDSAQNRMLLSTVWTTQKCGDFTYALIFYDRF